MNTSIEHIKQSFIEYFSSYISLSKEEILAIKKSMNIQSFKKGRLLLEENDISKDCYYIYKGLIRQYQIKDGLEKTTQFFMENDWAFFQESTTNQTPCGFYLSCEEECILIVGNEEKENELYDQFPRFAQLTKTLLEEKFGNQQQLLSSFIIDTPEQRYLNLLKNKPLLIQRVPQYQIASYLGITPESLSRIRKRLVQSTINH